MSLGAAVLTSGILPEIAYAQDRPEPAIKPPTPSITRPSEPRIQLPPAILRPREAVTGNMVQATHYDLHGLPTKNGEIMDRNGNTLAIPRAEYCRYGEVIGDYARITYPENGFSIIAKINDTGEMANPEYPEFKDLYLDVPSGLAERMGWFDLGNVHLYYEVLKNYSR